MDKKLFKFSAFLFMFLLSSIFCSISYGEESQNSLNEETFTEITSETFNRILSVDERKRPAYSLNARGMQAYKKKNYIEAGKYFKSAFLTDNSFTLAHYNYACMLSILRGDSSVCDWIFLDEIFEHLKISIQQDKNRRKRMQSDSDLDCIRMFPFYALLAADPELGLQRVISDTGTWYGPKPGVFPASPEIEFSNDGKFTISSFQMGDDGNGPFEFSEPVYGSYSINGTSITIRYDIDGESVVMKGIIHCKVEKGVITSLYITFDNLSLSLDSDPCSA